MRLTLAVIAASAGLAVLSFGARAGRADPAPGSPIASGSARGSAAAPAPTPPPENGTSAPDSAPHLLVTPPNYTFVDAGGDRPIRVLPSATPSQRALVYLHGYCGDVNAPGAFVPAAAEHGTLIALLGDQPCKDKPGRFKWSNDIHGLDERIRRALRLVNRALKLELDVKDITLFGYSQGAVRAESLARYYGKHYPRVILGGPPRRPKPEHFAGVRAIAVFGGEKEDTHDMLGGADDMIAAGEHAHFFLLPGVDHGDFGGEIAGNQSLAEILDFVDPPEKPAETPEKAVVERAP
jgi:predicted esterase